MFRSIRMKEGMYEGELSRNSRAFTPLEAVVQEIALLISLRQSLNIS
jgi:hypothetical protein